SPRLPAQLRVASRSDDSALVRQLSVRSMTLEASWTVAVGEHIRVEITAPGMTRRTRLEGRAVRVIPTGRSAAAPGYEIEVEFQYEVARPPRHESSMTFAAVRPEAIAAASGAPNVDADDDDMSSVLDNLFSALIHPTPSGPRPERRHLSGMLSRIRLPTLCALLDMERLTGRLTLEREGERLAVHVRDGRIVDVEVERGGEASRSPRALLTRLFSWTDGSFELDVVPVDRVDRLGLTMTALLLDLARESDEEKHRGRRA
ncbi:MAG TPA: DUF4388 domain-containing protein, partial [Labilithrix sp.]|nr:DUF4388 domain-containing protein [Labilithrix sp.]